MPLCHTAQVTNKTTLSEMAMLAAVVATLLYVPAAALLALLCFTVWDTSLHSFITFADTFRPFAGLLAWWVVGFIPAFAYAALVPPWKHGG
jgi:hypothetical protein